jgi:hypothetical protein
MDRPYLNDANEFPDAVVLARQLGAAKDAWDAFMALLKKDYPQIAAEWRYYNDGKSWLCKVTQKSKTICWVSVWEKYFRVGFYLNAKAEDLVRNSSLDIDKALKENFLTSNKKLRAITIEVRKKVDLNAVEELIGIKLKLK